MFRVVSRHIIIAMIPSQWGTSNRLLELELIPPKGIVHIRALRGQTEATNRVTNCAVTEFVQLLKFRMGRTSWQKIRN